MNLFHHLPIKARCRLACVSQQWRAASLVDAVSIKLKASHVPHYLHVALPDGAAQLQAAGCPIMSLARSADITWSSAAAAGSLLQSMPSLEVCGGWLATAAANNNQSSFLFLAPVAETKRMQQHNALNEYLQH